MNCSLKVENPYKGDASYDFIPPFRQLGPGPCNSTLTVLHPFINQPLTFANHNFYKVADDIQKMVKYIFQTKNEYTVIGQFSGNGGNEATIVNLADPGDTIIVATTGLWGMKVADFGRRYNLNVIELKLPLGEVYSVEYLEQQIIQHKPVTLYVTHGESSGGTLQPLEGLAKMCHKYDCLLAVDAVISLGVVPVLTDEWELDAVVSATQKGIGAPAGMCLLTLSDRANKRMIEKKHPTSYIFDLRCLGDFWNCYGKLRRYWNTFNLQMLMCVRQALLEICKEGLHQVWLRHKNSSTYFLEEADKLGMKHLIDQVDNRFCGVNCVVLPKDIKWPLLLEHTINKYNLEFGVGIGPIAGKCLRISFLAQNANKEVVDHFIKVLKESFHYIRNNSLDIKKCTIVEIHKKWLNNLTGEVFDFDEN